MRPCGGARRVWRGEESEECAPLCLRLELCPVGSEEQVPPLALLPLEVGQEDKRPRRHRGGGCGCGVRSKGLELDRLRHDAQLRPRYPCRDEALHVPPGRHPDLSRVGAWAQLHAPLGWRTRLARGRWAGTAHTSPRGQHGGQHSGLDGVGGKGIGNTARGRHVATACGRHGASGSAARRAGRRLHGVGSTSSAARRQSACSGARSPSVIVLEITQRGRSDAGHRRMPHGSPCSMTMAARVCAAVRALSSAHVLRIASASLTVSWPVRKSSPHLPQRRRKLPLDASGSMKPKATSTKKPEKPQPTATRHSTSTGSGPKTTSGGEGLQTRLGARTTNRLRSQMISRSPSVSSAQVLIRRRVINGRLGVRWRCSISARTKSSWSAWLSVRRMMSM